MFNLNFAELMTFGYWFNFYPGPFEGVVLWLMVGKMVAGFVLGFAGGILVDYVCKDPSYKKLIGKFSNLFYTQGVLLALTLFFTQTATPFLSSRFWLVVWFVILFVWFIFILKYWILVLPMERRDRNDRQQKQKYLA